MSGFADIHPDEREQLLSFLAHQRHLLRLTAYGLTDDQARLAPSASALSVGGVIEHVARTETEWIDIVAGNPAPFDPESMAAYAEGFVLAPGETLADVLAGYAAVADRTGRVVRSLPADHPVPVPRDVPWFPSDLEAWTLRWVLLHLIEETARHIGHADIVRESVDGATWFPLMAAAEHREPTPWVTPWSPADPAGHR